MNSKRDIGQEILDGIRVIKAGKGKRRTVKLPDDVRTIRERMDLSQSAFAALLGVSLRTLQDWEQGRRKPTGSAYALLRVATRHPEALIS
ncbi:MAG: helix-turn-helix domain-containing protein [Gammaproteobacteria bacterium]|nr:helix-turn-helix domain-containing protein [Gammaproteobacteria bacterium]MBU6509894.1 helix-turn-helix domain-containing protein [Gammaproteobacteria bacterium]MDE1984291.1 helix-turn-helix domain-containing protein [Gammaproteobacteria bacterium]MDE2461742.1 helix-turn-helix domain-containing protein [Gammaproteobacteria bacterium]